MPDNKKTCFVIMPFGTTTPEHTEEYWTKHFDDFLKPLIEEISMLQARRSEAIRGDVLKQIILDLTSSTIVVADLTDKNANVYWELGVRQSYRHGTITIAQSGTHIPFDLSTKGILWYFPNEYVKNDEFRRRFQSALRDCLAHPELPDSQVLETLSGRGTLFERFHREETIRRIDALLLELTGHLAFQEQAEGMAQKMLSHPGSSVQFIGRMIAPACELLLTNRYLDEDTAFYFMVHVYLERINELDSYTASLSSHIALTKTLEDFLATAKHVKEMNTKMNAMLTSIREKLVVLP